MSIYNKLTPEQIYQRLTAPSLQHWDLSNPPDSIERTFKFSDYLAGLRFVTAVAHAAESQGHHPDIRLMWCKVVISVTTHDQGGITDRDFVLAAAINKLYEQTI